MKERFKAKLLATCREGIPELLQYLDAHTDFYTAPASKDYHGCHAGGLLEHSLCVNENLLKIVAAFPEKFADVSPESLAIVSLMHDLCKVNFYKPDTRNTKQNGQWVTLPCFSIDDRIPIGHGEKSVILLQQFIHIDLKEVLAIRWHMGGFDDRQGYGTRQSLSAALNLCPLVAALHMADLAATFFDKK